jgi:hypothetical protein
MRNNGNRSGAKPVNGFKQLTLPRLANGLAKISFLKIESNSQLADQGIDVDFPFKNAAPDLGAFESDDCLRASIDLARSKPFVRQHFV